MTRQFIVRSLRVTLSIARASLARSTSWHVVEFKGQPVGIGQDGPQACRE
jgi:hypothetical protein